MRLNARGVILLGMLVFLICGIATAEQLAWKDWQNLASLTPGDHVAVYLRSGGRITETFREWDSGQIVLRSGPIRKQMISVLTRIHEDRLLNGVLLGAAMGFAFMAAVTAPVDDFSEGAWVIFGTIGAGGGAGIGALLDAGMARPEKVIYAPDARTEAIGSRRWKLTVRHDELSDWIWNRKVELMLQDGTYIRGEVHSGNGESIRFRVEDASVKSLKGEREIPSASISTVVYRERLNGSMAAAIFGGGLSGIFLGAIGGLATSDAANEGPRAAGGGIAGGLAGTVTGLALAERNWKEITLIVK